MSLGSDRAPDGDGAGDVFIAMSIEGAVGVALDAGRAGSLVMWTTSRGAEGVAHAASPIVKKRGDVVRGKRVTLSSGA